jgi:hypothetical protein
MKETGINSLSFSGLDPDSVKILARTVSVPSKDRLKSIEDRIAGINGALIKTTSTDEWFNQQVTLIRELERTRSKLEIK